MPPRCLSFSNSGTLLAVGLKCGTVVLLEYPSLAKVAEKREHKTPVNDVRFSPDDATLAAAYDGDGGLDFYR